MKAATKVCDRLSEKYGLGQMSNSLSKDRSQFQISLSNNSSKNRRRKGEGNGSIYWRTISLNG